MILHISYLMEHIQVIRKRIMGSPRWGGGGGGVNTPSVHLASAGTVFCNIGPANRRGQTYCEQKLSIMYDFDFKFCMSCYYKVHAHALNVNSLI